MMVSFGHHAFTFSTWDPGCNSLTFLSTYESGYIELGVEEDDIARDDVITFYLDQHGSQVRRFGILVHSIVRQPSPHILLQEANNQLVVGYNNKVVAIDIGKLAIVFSVELPCLFHSFIPVIKGILILHETGVLRISERGVVLWEHSGDVITDSAIVNAFLTIHFMDGSRTILDIDTGKSVEPPRNPYVW